MLNKCKKTQNLIFDYIDGILPIGKQKSVKKHLDSCSTCNSVYKESLLLKEQLSNIKLEELPEDFEKELHLKLAQENTAKRKNRIFIPALSSAVAAAMVAVVMFSVNFKTNQIENENLVYEQPKITGMSRSKMATNDVMYDTYVENLKAEITGTYAVEINSNDLFEQLKNSYNFKKDGEYYFLDCTIEEFDKISQLLSKNNLQLTLEENSEQLKIKIKK